MSVRRPLQRRLHAPLRLDQDRPTPDRPRRSITRRPRPAEYWAWRRRKAPLPVNNTTQRLHQAQDGRCPICKGTLLAADHRPQTPREWEQWLASNRTTTIIIAMRAGTTDETEPRLIHAHCRKSTGQALLLAYEPPGLA